LPVAHATPAAHLRRQNRLTEGISRVDRERRTRTILARATPLVKMHVRVLNHPDDHRDNHDQQRDPEHQYARRRIVA
jgi:hypothetical protein